MKTVAQILEENITLEVDCIDRIYINGYIPHMQLPGQLTRFILDKGYSIPSPAILRRITKEFNDRVIHFAHVNDIKTIQFKRGQRKDDIANQYRKKFDKPYGVVFIGTAQEKAYAFKGKKTTDTTTGYIGFEYSRQSVRVKHFYYYLHDEEFGPGFIKICTYAPYAMKICLNGHEWVKQQLRKKGITFQTLDNGFLSCEDPVELQAICDSLAPADFEAFLDRWFGRIPFPLTAEDRQLGYNHRLSIHQIEVSLTHVFTRPLDGRQFFESVIRENLDLGRPDRVQLVFEKRIQKNTPSRFRTRVITSGVSPSIHVEYKHCDLKQYFKENRALRTETTINDPKDFSFKKDISNLRLLRAKGSSLNRRLLDVQRLAHDCMMTESNVKQIVQPTITSDGQRAPGLRFGDTRVTALFGALTSFSTIPNGFTNKSLRGSVADLLGPEVTAYTSNKMTYDLRRLRLKGIIYRVAGSNRYFLTEYGRRVVYFFTKLEQRLFRVGFSALDKAVAFPRKLANAFQALDKEIERLIGAVGFCNE